MISSTVGECVMYVEWVENVLSPVRFNLLRLRSRWVAAATTRTLVRNSLFTSQKHTTVIIMDFPFRVAGGGRPGPTLFHLLWLCMGWLNVVRLNKASLYHRINRFILLTENSTTTTASTTTTTITIFKSINQNTKIVQEHQHQAGQ